MTDLVHSHTVPQGLGLARARLGAGLQRLGARLIEARMRQAEAVVAERRNWIEGTRATAPRHDADGYFL